MTLSIVSLFGLVFFFIINRHHKHELAIRDYHDKIGQIRTLLYRSLNLQSDFLLTDTKTETFYITGNSKSLRLFDKNIQALRLITTNLQKHTFTQRFDLTEDILRLRDLIANHHFNLMDLKRKSLKRGFYNYGLEGEFRNAIHTIENDFKDVIALADILQIRRKEKDFMLRHNLEYWQENKALIDSIRANLGNNSRATSASMLLSHYSNTFGEFVVLDTIIGFDESHGIRKKIAENAEALLAQLDLITGIQQEKLAIYTRKSSFAYLLYTALFFGLLVIIIYALSTSLSKPILTLSKGVDTFFKHDFLKKVNLSATRRKDEIGDLARKFERLQVEITDHFASYRENSVNKQRKLEEQKEKIQIQKYLIQESRDILKEEIEEMNNSIHYAQRIQQSLLPNKSRLKQIFNQIDIMYLPKDIVSGDFYWVHEDDRYQFAAMADCTGHGVPGAFMSMLGSSYLNYGVKDKKITDTSVLLDYLNAKVKDALAQNDDDSRLKEGMDISLIRIDRKTNMLQFSGAQRELVIIRNKKLIRLAPDKYPIGFYLPDEQVYFSTQTFQLQPDDLIFMYSDGLTDQFGGPKNKKFKRRPLYDLLITMADMPVESMSQLLETHFKLWRGAHDQTDDITAVIIKHTIKEASSTERTESIPFSHLRTNNELNGELAL